MGLLAYDAEMRLRASFLASTVVLLVSQAQGDTQVSAPRASAAKNDLLRSGCKLVSGRFDCTTLAGGHKARAYLAAGEIGDYSVDTFQGGDAYMAPAQKFTATTTPSVTLKAREESRTGGSSTGSVAYSVKFDVVRWGPAPANQCNPSCSALPASKCARKTKKKDAVRVALNGPAAGLFSIGASPNLGAPITGSFSPTDDDRLRAWDACEHANAWGGTTSLALRYRVSAVFHIDNWETKPGPGGCTATNKAALPNPTVELSVPIEVECKARPQVHTAPRSQG